MALNEERKLREGSHSSQADAPVVPITPLAQMEHLLRVASSVTQDANKAWAEVWNELKHCAPRNGGTDGQAAKAFVPSCGWPEFLEKLWLLKHYLDSIHRICNHQH